jgi:integrase
MLTLGPYSDKKGEGLGLDEARMAALQARAKVKAGHDPALEQWQALHPEEDCTFLRVATDYIETYAKPKNKSYLDTARLLGLRPTKPPINEPWEIIPGTPVALWASRNVASIKDADISSLLEAKLKKVPKTKDRPATGGPGAARQTWLALSGLFKWARSRLLIAANPVHDWSPKAILPPAKKRKRYLTLEEIRALWNAAEPNGGRKGKAGMGVAGLAVRLLLATGLRKEEVFSMTWPELSADLTTWLIPARTKNDQPHLVPLSTLAQEILAKVPRIPSRAGWVFTLNGRSRIQGHSHIKKRLDKAMPKPPPYNPASPNHTGVWWFHDFRRTAAVAMQRLGVPLEVTEATLGHSESGGSRSGIVGIYQTYAYETEQRDALELWGQELRAIVFAGRGTGLPARGRKQ